MVDGTIIRYGEGGSVMNAGRRGYPPDKQEVAVDLIILRAEETVALTV